MRLTAASNTSNSTTSWDPSFDTSYYFGGPMELFPRMQQWINQNYPGTGICVSEYFTDSDGTNGSTPGTTSGVIQAETLGLYGKYGLRLAAYWNGVTSGGTHLPVWNAFAMFRNYDGNGGHFGGVSIGAVSPIADVSIFGPSDSATAPTRLWVMIINKTSAAQNGVALQIANFAPGAAAHLYQAAGGGAPTKLGDLPVTSGGLTVNLPALSTNLLVIAQ